MRRCRVRSPKWIGISHCAFTLTLTIARAAVTKSSGSRYSQPPPQFGEEIPTIRQNNSAGLFFGEMLPSHQDYGPGPPNTLSLWLLCCQRHVETLIS